uniref:Zinc finger BED domain-containing protein 4 n=2 Tax=Lygus hesperus TaxID=30085 RepID=A0A0A9VVY1_LYGHE
MDISEDAVVALALRKQVVKQIDRRFGQIENVEVFALATLVDPRFKKLHFREPLAHARAVTKLSAKIAELQRSASSASTSTQAPAPAPVPAASDDVWSLHDNMVANADPMEPDNPGGISGELRQYLNTPLAPRVSNPLEVWETLKPVYPHLYKVARNYLGRVATSVPAERLFSKAGATATDRRNRLTGKRLSTLLFLSSLEASFFF